MENNRNRTSSSVREWKGCLRQVDTTRNKPSHPGTEKEKTAPRPTIQGKTNECNQKRRYKRMCGDGKAIVRVKMNGTDPSKFRGEGIGEQRGNIRAISHLSLQSNVV